MKLLKVKIENFRFLKSFELKFATDSKKNLTVVRAANESGKTTLLYALQWAIFGENALPKRGADFRLSALDQVGEIDVNVTIDFSITNIRGDESFYILKRSVHETAVKGSWNRPNKSEIALHKRTDTGVDYIDYAQGWLKPHLPEELREVFFTDGDRALSFIEGTDTDQSKKVEGAIRSLLGLEIIENAATHTRQIKTNLNKKLKDGSQESVELQNKSKRIDDLNEKIPKDEIKEKELAESLNAATESYDQIDKAVGIALAAGDKNKLNATLKKAREDKDRANLEYLKTTKSQSELFKSKDLGIGLLNNDINRAFSLLEKLYDSGVLPNNAVPILRDRLKGTTCFCGACIDASKSEGSFRRKTLEDLITKSEEETPVNQLATTLFFRAEALINSSDPTYFKKHFSSYMQARDDAVSRKKEAGLQEANVEAEIDEIPETNIVELQKLKSEYRTAKDTFREDLVTIRANLYNDKNSLSKLEDEQGKLLGINVKGRQLLAEFQVSQDLLDLFTDSLKQMKEIELSKVSNLMNDIFLRMIGAGEDNTETGIILKAEINSNFKISVHGNSGNTLDPSQDLNGASRRALTIAFIMALTKVSEVVAPNVIDTPLGMTSGYVKNSILKLACENSSQLIMFLTHDEIKGCENLIDKFAGVVSTMTNPAHYPKILVHEPEVSDIRAVQCECNHRESCNACERRENEELS